MVNNINQEATENKAIPDMARRESHSKEDNPLRAPQPNYLTTLT